MKKWDGLSRLTSQIKSKIIFFKCFFVGLSILATYIFLVFSTNEPGLGAGIDPGMAFNADHFHLVFWPRFEPTTLVKNHLSLTNIHWKRHLVLRSTFRNFIAIYHMFVICCKTHIVINVIIFIKFVVNKASHL